MNKSYPRYDIKCECGVVFNTSHKDSENCKGCADRKRAERLRCWGELNPDKKREFAANMRKAVRRHDLTSWLSPEAQLKSRLNRSWYRPTEAHRKAISIKFKGRPATGKIAKGEHHIRAKLWAVRDDRGVLHEFKNMSHWIRNNLEKFEYLRDEQLRSTHFDRIRVGLGQLFSHGGNVPGSWHGWTAVSVIEREDPTCEDLLARKF